VIVTVNSNTIR